jgi:hypothetical protein
MTIATFKTIVFGDVKKAVQDLADLYGISVTVEPAPELESPDIHRLNECRGGADWTYDLSKNRAKFTH